MLWHDRCIERRTKISISFADLAAQCFAEACWRFAYFFCQKMLVLATIDVARGHLGYCNIGFVQTQIGSVIGKHRHSVNCACNVAVEHDDLATTRRIVCVAQCLAVHAHITKRFFYDAIWLTCNNEAVFSNADIQTLSTTAECK